MPNEKPLIAPRFRCRSTDMWLDGWNYGHGIGRQYMCKHADGSTQAARLSMIPVYAFIVGAMLVTCMVFVLWIESEKPGTIIWTRVYGGMIIGALLLSIPIAAWLWKFNWMTAVGPRQYHGRRVFWGEDDIKPEWETGDE